MNNYIKWHTFKRNFNIAWHQLMIWRIGSLSLEKGLTDWFPCLCNLFIQFMPFYWAAPFVKKRTQCGQSALDEYQRLKQVEYFHLSHTLLFNYSIHFEIYRSVPYFSVKLNSIAACWLLIILNLYIAWTMNISTCTLNTQDVRHSIFWVFRFVFFQLNSFASIK